MLQYFDVVKTLALEISESLNSVKFRASGKKVRLPIGREKGLTLLKKYLEFRAWMLDDAECKWLFPHVVGKNYSPDREYKKMPTGLQSRFFYKTLIGKYLPQHAKNITTTHSRKYKSAILHELQASPLTVAGVIGHTLSTIYRNEDC